MLSCMISVCLQLPILHLHSTLMRTMVGMSLMLTWTDQQMQRSVIIFSKAPLSDMDMEEDAEIHI